MATRLDRLFLLLDTGSTPVTRRAAAVQLGEVQKLHPHELPNLLSRVAVFLKSSNWDTRIAAGQAIEAIAQNVPQWKPARLQADTLVQVKVEVADGMENASEDNKLEFSKFEIKRVLQHGEPLVGSSGEEYDMVDEEIMKLDPKQRIAWQQKLMRKRLGLDIAPGLDVGMDKMFSDEDLLIDIQHTKVIKKQKSTESAAEIVAAEIAAISSSKGLSSREKNRAKRKAKLLAKQRSKDGPDPQTHSNPGSFEGEYEEAPSAKKRCTASVVVDQPADPDKIVVDSVTDVAATLEESGEWPFENFCLELCHELFNQSWEVRHGAATGLREIIKVHGGGAGKTNDMSASELDVNNKKWLENMALHLLCVLALDRFGDFVSDEVVAPVRETCAQTIGVILKHMDIDGARRVMMVLLTLQAQTEWEVRHGGLLGLKYLLAVRQDITGELLPMVLDPILIALQDDDDDVRAVAASALLPVIEGIVKYAPDKVEELVTTLWDTLVELDDLTASTNSIMTLLAGILACPSVSMETISEAGSLSVLVPRLWPFLKHAIRSVRSAALNTLQTLLISNRTKTQGLPVKEKDCAWLTPIMQDAFRHIYQRYILESDETVLELVYKVWCELLENASKEHLAGSVVMCINGWIGMMMLPACLPIDPSLLIQANHRTHNRLDRGHEKAHMIRGRPQTQSEPAPELVAGATQAMSVERRDRAVLNARIAAARALGLLALYLKKYPGNMDPEPLDYLLQTLAFPLSSNSAVQRISAVLLISEWAACDKQCKCPDSTCQQLLAILTEQIVYDEIVVLNTRLQTDCQGLIVAFREKGIDVSSGVQPGCQTVETASHLVSASFTEAIKKLPIPQVKPMELKRKHVMATIGQLQYEFQKLHVRFQASVAGCLVLLDNLPPKLNPIIRPIMDAIKKEEDSLMQSRAANSLAILLELCMSREPCPNSKIVKNLCTFACSDPSTTPSINLNMTLSTDEAPASPVSAGAPASPLANQTGQGVSGNDKERTIHCDQYNGILTLVQQHKVVAAMTARKNATINSKAKIGSTVVDGVSLGSMDTAEDPELSKQLLIQRRGAEFALVKLANHFGSSLPESLPKLWETVVGPIKDIGKDSDFKPGNLRGKDTEAQNIVSSLQLFEILVPVVHSSLLEKLLDLLPNLVSCLRHPYCAVRHMAARTIGVLSVSAPVKTMQFVIGNIIALLGTGDVLEDRQGAIECISNVIQHMELGVVPYVVLLVVPVLGRMSDQCEDVRLMASQCFAKLIRLMPLEAGIPDPVSMPDVMVEQKQKERRFLEQLLDGTKLENYKISLPIKAELRKYQQDGVNWLAFLNKYKLHGILCDDMGLGKTLQSICIMADDNYLKASVYKETGNPDCKPLPSLVICPPTLTGHWCYEVEKFVSREYLKPLHYTGAPSERQRLRSKLKNHNLVIASYDIVRNDSEFFRSVHWNYCILDEGHIIKNGKTKLSKVIKQLKSSHRLILSGTPIQNNVLELWSLFDFLMPGFLGTEKQFQAQYGKPILQSRDAKSSSKEQEAGALAMEALHRQVLPFLLRRLKEDVLQDLPPKIIQDYYCELSPLQVQLYEDFAKSQTKKGLEESFSLAGHKEDDEKPKKESTHIFQALQYLKKVCNHPLLVLKQEHPEYEKVTEQLKDQKSSLRDIHHAAKLVALKQLLIDCGIGLSSASGSNDVATEPVVSQHRVLLFCQLKSMLDIVENDLLKGTMPGVTYLRLDGSTPVGQRYNVVHRFNNDPSIDILLLTTHVGGLGLNLTGADTVIFVEHDWNPMKDLQAMDRAHRIGQKKVVNVYRLITRGTLEEKIMGLQKFKLNIANSVITQDNSSLQTMDTGQLLDLFSVEKEGKKKNSSAESSTQGNPSSKGLKSVLESLGELWDESQYETEYNLDSFIESLG